MHVDTVKCWPDLNDGVCACVCVRARAHVWQCYVIACMSVLVLLLTQKNGSELQTNFAGEFFNMELLPVHVYPYCPDSWPLRLVEMVDSSCCAGFYFCGSMGWG
jgi:hypothetical protein